MKRLNLVGKRFGRLTIIKYSHSHIQPSNQKRAIWLAKCDCGKKHFVSTSSLISGHVVSCGCYGKEIRKKGLHKKERGVANLNYKYLSYRARSKKHGIPFEISKKEFKEIIDQNCYYCGGKPEMPHTHRSYNGLYISNGIDRINSQKGYIKGNVVPCCKLCNTMKSNLSEEEFINHIKKIYKNICHL